MTSLRNGIARALYHREWTDGDLALRCGLSRSRVNRIKNGRAVPSVGEALAIAAALDLPTDRIFWLENRPDDPSRAER